MCRSYDHNVLRLCLSVVYLLFLMIAIRGFS